MLVSIKAAAAMLGKNLEDAAVWNVKVLTFFRAYESERHVDMQIFFNFSLNISIMMYVPTKVCLSQAGLL